MSTSKETLLYMIADILGVDLHLTGDKTIRGFSTRKFSLGEMGMVSSDVLVQVDEASDQRATAVARIAGPLWLYVFVTPASQNLLLVDGEKAKLFVGQEYQFCTGKAATTLPKLKTAIVGAWVNKPSGWAQVDPAQLL